MHEFFAALFEHGRCRMATDAVPSHRERQQAVAAILAWEREYRASLPGEPPQPSPEAVDWSAACLYRAAQFLVYRHLPKELMEQELSAACPASMSPEVCYSVDLTFRFLPDLGRLVRAAAQADPLVDRLQAWAGDWPLSSVGFAGVTPVSLDGFIEHPALRTLYVDRILATRDVGRLSDVRVSQAVQAALGGFPELAAEVSSALAKREATAPLEPVTSHS